MEMIEEQLAYQRRMGGEASGEFLPWCFEVVIDERKENSAENYIVFSNYNYSDMGGAHGSMSGEGAMTFDARSGRRFRNFLKDKSDAALRELILDGLVSCFSQEEKGVSRSSVSDLLLVGKEELSAPTQDPLPTDSGLLFQYQAYEIAPYAAGMPAFVLSYDKIRPFLTDEAATLLGVR